MANRNNLGVRSQSKSSGSNCGTKAPSGIHFVATQLQSEKKISKRDAYIKAFKLCKTPVVEIEKIDKSLRLNISDLLPA